MRYCSHEYHNIYISSAHIVAWIALSAMYYMAVFGDADRYLNNPLITGSAFDAIYERKSHIDHFYGRYAVAEFNIQLLGIICSAAIQLASFLSKSSVPLFTPIMRLIGRIAVSGTLVFIASTYGPAEPREANYASPYSWIGSTFYGHLFLLACLLLFARYFFRDIFFFLGYLLPDKTPSTKD